MSNFPNQSDANAEHAGPDQFSEMPPGGGSDAIFVEEKKPINRNLILLVLLMLLGGTMVYFMYVRGSSKINSAELNADAAASIPSAGQPRSDLVSGPWLRTHLAV